MYNKINIEIKPSQIAEGLQTAKILCEDHTDQVVSKNVDIYDLISFFKSLDQDTTIDTGFMSNKLVRKVQKGSVTTKFYYAPFLTTSFKIVPYRITFFKKDNFLFLLKILRTLKYEFTIKVVYRHADETVIIDETTDPQSLHFDDLTIQSLVIHNFTFRNCGLIIKYNEQSILSYRVVFYENSSYLMYNVSFDKDTKAIIGLLPNHFNGYICWGSLYNDTSFEETFKSVRKGDDEQAWRIVSTYLQSPFNEDLMNTKNFNQEYIKIIEEFYARHNIITSLSPDDSYSDIIDRLLYVWIPSMNSPEVYLELPNLYSTNSLTYYLSNDIPN